MINFFFFTLFIYGGISIHNYFLWNEFIADILEKILGLWSMRHIMQGINKSIKLTFFSCKAYKVDVGSSRPNFGNARLRDVVCRLVHMWGHCFYHVMLFET